MPTDEQMWLEHSDECVICNDFGPWTCEKGLGLWSVEEDGLLTWMPVEE